ncbi:MAG: S-layer homology domain-containing protein, partial [Actinomycetota bacterium]|nr:S-layer homology domain-containing protein [Actinomycetota bacterium]
PLLGGVAAADVADPAAGACPPDEVSASTFTDIRGNLFDLEIRCLADYGITQGTTATTYSPTSPVSRQQMALFLARLTIIAVDPEQLEGLEDAEPAPFSDLAGATPEAQVAITLLWNLDVMRGTSPTTFNPTSMVTRGQMATMIDQLQAVLQGDDEGFPTPDEDVFDDDEGSPHEAAINAIAAAGIAEGAAPGRFVPGAQVTRAQMAAFLMRHVQVNVEAGLVEPIYEIVEPGAVQLTVTPQSVAPGQSVQARVSGCQPQQPAQFALAVGAGGVVQGGQADAQGVFVATLTVPADAQPGQARLVAACLIDDGTAGTAETLVTITG